MMQGATLARADGTSVDSLHLTGPIPPIASEVLAMGGVSLPIAPRAERFQHSAGVWGMDAAKRFLTGIASAILVAAWAACAAAQTSADATITDDEPLIESVEAGDWLYDEEVEQVSLLQQPPAFSQPQPA